LDAEIVFKESLPTAELDDHKLCICGKILKGLAKPFECKVFGKACTPKNPMGSCMVSSEGACAAYFKYGNLNLKGDRA
jgi:hydrogenase expression/formation protein HypD